MNRVDIQTKVTDTIIASLEAGTVPWKRPWDSAGEPANFLSRRAYRGINVLLLWGTAAEKGFTSRYWLTYKQATESGGQVRKGEKSTAIVFWKILDKDEDNKVPLLRYYNVFNTDQIDGLDVPTERTVTVTPEQIPAAVQDVLTGYKDAPRVIYGQSNGRAFYRPSDDVIHLPDIDQFHSVEGYADTLFHELGHSTGHSSRLAREHEGACFGNTTYAKEELVAEITAAMLAAKVGINWDVQNTAAYVANWLQVLKDDRSLVISAAQQAQKAVDHILPQMSDEQQAA
jgi:antirestriction protein ArdC